MPSRDLERLKIDRRLPRRRWRLAPTLFAVVLAAATGAYWYFFQARVEVQAATVVQVFPSQKYTLLNATGYVVPQRKAAVASKATGRLEWLGVAEGSRVRAGQLIARLENRDVVAARDQAVAQLQVARANLSQAEAELADAQRALERAQELAGKNFLSRAALDQAVARWNKAEAAVTGAQAAIAAAEAGLRSAEIAVEQTLIRAPFDGVVLVKHANIGDVVSPFNPSPESKGAVVSMADMSSLEVEVDVSESNLFKVSVGQACEIQLDALPEVRFEGVVRRMVPTVDRSKATVLVKVGFIELDPRVLPDMSARVAFLSHPVPPEERAPRLAVAPEAIVQREGHTLTFVIDSSQRAVATPVEVGEPIGGLVEVRRGLALGQTVVKSPPRDLRDGTRVSVRKN